MLLGLGQQQVRAQLARVSCLDQTPGATVSLRWVRSRNRLDLRGIVERDTNQRDVRPDDRASLVHNDRGRIESPDKFSRLAGLVLLGLVQQRAPTGCQSTENHVDSALHGDPSELLVRLLVRFLQIFVLEPARVSERLHCTQEFTVLPGILDCQPVTDVFDVARVLEDLIALVVLLQDLRDRVHSHQLFLVRPEDLDRFGECLVHGDVGAGRDYDLLRLLIVQDQVLDLHGNISIVLSSNTTSESALSRAGLDRE